MKKYFLISFLFLASIAQAQPVKEDDPKRVEKEVYVKEEVNKVRIYLTGDYTMIGSPADDGQDLTAFGITVQGHYSFGERWGAALSTWQSFSMSGESVITAFDGRLTYAITGKLRSTDRITMIDSVPVSNVTDYDMSGFRVQALAVQYYFNASNNTVPYHGFGLATYYEHTTNTRISYLMGARMDFIASGEFSTTPLQIFFGIGSPF